MVRDGKWGGETMGSGGDVLVGFLVDDNGAAVVPDAE